MCFKRINDLTMPGGRSADGLLKGEAISHAQIQSPAQGLASALKGYHEWKKKRMTGRKEEGGRNEGGREER
jgi:hypothetical protein